MCLCIFCLLLLDVMQSFLISFMCSFYFVFFTLYPFILFSIVFIFFKLVLFFCLWLRIFFLIQSRLDVSSAIYFQKETYTLNRLVCFFLLLFSSPLSFLFFRCLRKAKHQLSTASQQAPSHTIKYSPAIVDLAVALS